MKFRDYYEVLGVPRTATAEEIKRAYRKMAKKHHPDLQPVAERAAAAERFKEVNEANEVLSDPDKRRKYDALGPSWKGGQDYSPPPGSGWTGRASTGDFGDVGGFSDFFEAIFGGRGGPGGGRSGRTRWSGRGAGGEGAGFRVSFPGSDVEAELPVTVEELLRGGRRRITVDGRGIEVEIPLGARPETTLRLAGQGERGMGEGAPGDLYLKLRLVPHPRYRIDGDDIEMDLALWPWQAVLGGPVRIETPDGSVTLKVPPTTQSGKRLRLRGRGLPRGKTDGDRGDFQAVVRIVIPEQPSASEQDAYEALKRSATSASDRPAGEEEGKS